jgi:hypothetical protein
MLREALSRTASQSDRARHIAHERVEQRVPMKYLLT